jgi:transcription elongation regulator 1
MSESSIARLYDDWSRRRSAQAKKDFEKMLSESSFVDYWGKLKQEMGSKEHERAKEVLGNEGDAGADEDDVNNVEEGVDLRAMAAQIDMKELHAVLKVSLEPRAI